MKLPPGLSWREDGPPDPHRPRPGLSVGSGELGYDAELRAFFADATLILTDPETDGKHVERLGAIRAITRLIFDVRAEATSNLRELASRGFKPFIAQESRDPR